MSSRSNQWFVPGEGIAREVITADIQRYLGPDALVRPGTGTGEYEVRLSRGIPTPSQRTLLTSRTGPTGLLDYCIPNSHNGTLPEPCTSKTTRLTDVIANDSGPAIGLAALAG